MIRALTEDPAVTRPEGTPASAFPDMTEMSVRKVMTAYNNYSMLQM